MNVYRRQQRYSRQEGAGRRCVVLARPSQPEEPVQPQGTPIAIPNFKDLANSRQYEGLVADKVCSVSLAHTRMGGTKKHHEWV
jgi:hypothetical protein